MTARPDPSIRPVPTTDAIAVAVLAGDAAYDMFEVVTADAVGAQLRGPLLFEIGEEFGVRITRGATTAVARGRVTSHDAGGPGIVTSVVFVDNAAELKRFFG
jgi:hypothetical protein